MKKVFLITGCNGSVGSALLKYFSKKNINIIGIDNKKEKIKKKKNIFFYNCDLKSDKSVKNTFKKINIKFKKIDVVINAAGLIYSSLLFNYKKGSIQKHLYKDWKKVLSSNLDTAFLSTLYSAEHMISNNQKGVIINISSVSAEGNVGQVAYSSSKAAVETLSKTIAKELSIFGIRVACLAPGFFLTKSTKRSLTANEIEKIKNNTSVKRFGKISELIKGVEFIINNKFFNGKTLNLDGGLWIK